MIGSTDNHSGNFIQPDWLKKGQQGENGLVSSAVKPENLNQKAVEELTKKLGQEPDKKEENSFAAAYGVLELHSVSPVQTNGFPLSVRR